MYRINGIEFLPEGFLELDPLLFKHEFGFRSPEEEKLFDEEQKRIKVLRRRQYAEKNTKRIRDVTIYA